MDIIGMLGRRKHTVNGHRASWKTTSGWFAVILLLAIAVGCSKAPKSSEDAQSPVKKIPANAEFSGFLKDYSALKHNPALDGDELTYVSTDAKKNLRSYFAIVIDPIQVYVATDADASKVDDASRKALTNYFQHALAKSVSDAFPITETAGPLTLRLRVALVGVDVGGQVAAGDVPADSKPLQRALNIGKVGVEMELLDSETGERIAAVVDRTNLGAGAEVGAENFSRVEKFAAARDAFDEWASRLRAFLDSEHELKGEDLERVEKSYLPYGGETASK
jgi:Protein of unknown function (DUF3313)